MDKDNDGYIDQESISSVLKQCSLGSSKRDIDEILNELDRNPKNWKFYNLRDLLFKMFGDIE